MYTLQIQANLFILNVLFNIIIDKCINTKCVYITVKLKQVAVLDQFQTLFINTNASSSFASLNRCEGKS